MKENSDWGKNNLYSASNRNWVVKQCILNVKTSFSFSILLYHPTQNDMEINAGIWTDFRTMLEFSHVQHNENTNY